jgi:hypothetical protein
MPSFLPRLWSNDHVRALVVALTFALAACSSSGGGSHPASIQDVIEAWPASAGTLHTVSSQDLRKLHQAFPGATEIQVRSLMAPKKVPDVIFISRNGGFTSAQARTMWRQAARALQLELGIAALAGRSGSVDALLPFRGPGGAYCWLVPRIREYHLNGFAAPLLHARTACAFVAHGVGVVVIFAAYDPARAEALISALQH